MKKRILLENEALDYLRGAIMQGVGAKDRSTAKKMDICFKAVAIPLKEYREEANGIRVLYRVERKDAEGKVVLDGEGEPMYKFPKETEPMVEAEMNALGEKKVAIDFEREAFAILNSEVDNIFNREEVKEKGISGEVQMKMLALIDDAFAAVQDID